MGYRRMGPLSRPSQLSQYLAYFDRSGKWFKLRNKKIRLVRHPG